MSTPYIPNILLVDDEEENIWVIEDFLKNLPCKIYKAYDGQQALKLAPVISPDLILLDINMPEINGIEVCRLLKKEDKFQNTPIIFVTAWGDLSTHVEAIEAGGYSFVTKPVAREQLLAYVSQALHVKQTGDHSINALEHTRSAVGMLVHDLRNLIQVNHGYLQLVLGTRSLSTEASEFVHIAKQSAMEMQILVNAILDIEKKESVGLQVALSTVSLSDLLQQRVTYASVIGQGKQLDVFLPGPDERAEVTTDEVILSRVLDNLLLNALKFAPAKSLIEVKLQALPPGWRLSVLNDGKPIPAEYHHKVFEKFSQIELKQKAGLRGVGLGLAFCKMAMDALGGSISVQSPLPGKTTGTAFHLDIPLSVNTEVKS